MKVIYTAGIKKKAQLWDFIVEKSKGIYDKIRSVFVKDDEATQEAIDLEREEGIEEGENFESLMGQQEISKTLREEAIPTESVEPDVLETYNEQQASAVNSIGEDIEIGYRTFYSNILIPKRTIRPLYTRYAETTGNYILVSWDYDMNDFRAFVIPNILPATEVA